MRVIVAGGGIAGLTAALALHDRLGAGAEITLIDGADRLGGKLRTGRVGDRVVETGAETFLARAADDPGGGPSAAVRLASRLGLPLTHPVTTAAGMLTHGELRPMPGGTLMGIPADASTFDSAFGPVSGADVDTGSPVLAPGADVTVGSLVRARIGDAVVDRLVDPLLGGVYAGRADDLSLAVTMPGLAESCRRERTLGAAVRSTLARRPRVPAPAFATVAGGLSRLVDAIVAAMPAVRIRTGLPVRSLGRAAGGGWQVVAGSAHDPVRLEADAVVIAVPSHPAARLLAGVDPEAAALVGTLDYASIGLVTLALPAGSLHRTALAGRSGALIPAVEGRLVKAITVFSTKWAPQPDGVVLLRASIGRYGDEASLRLSDEDLVAAVHDDISKIVTAPLAPPLASAVTRWGGALPQYTPGHSGRIEAARALLPGTIALAGAACDGVGIPICVGSGEAAAAQVIGAV